MKWLDPTTEHGRHEVVLLGRVNQTLGCKAEPRLPFYRPRKPVLLPDVVPSNLVYQSISSAHGPTARETNLCEAQPIER